MLICKKRPKSFFAFAEYETFIKDKNEFNLFSETINKFTVKNDKGENIEMIKIIDKKKILKIKLLYSLINLIISLFFIFIFINGLTTLHTKTTFVLTTILLLLFIADGFLFIKINNFIYGNLLILGSFILFLLGTYIFLKNSGIFWIETNFATIFFISFFFFITGIAKILNKDNCLCEDANFYYLCKEIKNEKKDKNENNN